MKKILESIGSGIASCYTNMKYGKDKISESLPASFYELNAFTLQGHKPVAFSQFRDKVVLVVNIASLCGYTAGYNKFLSSLASGLKSREDFVILAFPCGQFGGQEHSEEKAVCSAHLDGLKDCKECFDRSLLLMEKVDVNGDTAHEVFKWLRSHSSLNDGKGKVSPIPWNYGKFLINKQGQVETFFKSGEYDEVTKAVNTLLLS